MYHFDVTNSVFSLSKPFSFAIGDASFTLLMEGERSTLNHSTVQWKYIDSTQLWPGRTETIYRRHC